MIRRNVPSESPAERYVQLLLALYECIRSGRGDGDEAEAIRDQMDLPWRDLGARERRLVEGLAADLSDSDKSPPSSSFEPDSSVLQQIRHAGQAQEWELVLDLVRRHADFSPPVEVARLRGVCWASLNFPSVAILFFRQIAHYTTLRPEDEVFLLRCLIQVDRAGGRPTGAGNLCRRYDSVVAADSGRRVVRASVSRLDSRSRMHCVSQRFVLRSEAWNWPQTIPMTRPWKRSGRTPTFTWLSTTSISAGSTGRGTPASLFCPRPQATSTP